MASKPKQRKEDSQVVGRAQHDESEAEWSEEGIWAEYGLEWCSGIQAGRRGHPLGGGWGWPGDWWTEIGSQEFRQDKDGFCAVGGVAAEMED